MANRNDSLLPLSILSLLLPYPTHPFSSSHPFLLSPASPLFHFSFPFPPSCPRHFCLQSIDSQFQTTLGQKNQLGMERKFSRNCKHRNKWRIYTPVKVSLFLLIPFFSHVEDRVWLKCSTATCVQRRRMTRSKGEYMIIKRIYMFFLLLFIYSSPVTDYDLCEKALRLAESHKKQKGHAL